VCLDFTDKLYLKSAVPVGLFASLLFRFRSSSRAAVTTQLRSGIINTVVPAWYLVGNDASTRTYLVGLVLT
jgi:hypothetical protein